MDVLDGFKLSQHCDYSFGDQSGRFGNIFNSFMKQANISNKEFALKVTEISNKKNVMTVFIDNIRLYKRPIAVTNPKDLAFVNDLMDQNDLLNLLGQFDQMKFIVFTNLEDTPIDSHIEGKIPRNVLAISAVNAEYFGGKVVPAPYGLKRQMNPNDNRNEILKNFMLKPYVEPRNLLYVNHTIESNLKERKGINEFFRKKKWATVHKKRIKFEEFLLNIQKHKFMICPIGNAVDCHRNWEVLYLRRVPIMKNHPYLKELFKDFPVLFVDDYKDVTEDLLLMNNHLFEQIKQTNLESLMLPTFYEKFVSKHSLFDV